MALTQISTKGIKDGTISTADLADDAITTAKIAATAITQAEIANGAVGQNQLASGAVITAKISSGAVTNGKLANSSVGISKIQNGIINNAKIASDAAIAGTKISPNFGSQNIVTTGFITSNDITISDTSPTLNFTDTNHNSDFRITTDGGLFKVIDSTNSADRIAVHSDGEVDLYGHVDIGAGLDVTGNITATGTIPATNIDIAGVTTSAALQIVFSTGNSGTAKTLAVDSTSSKFTYDPGSNLLQVDNIKLPDSSGSDGKINLGTGVGTVGDFQIYFDGSAGVIKNTTGNLFVQSIGDVKLRTNDSELAVNCIVDSAVELYHNSTSGSASKKLETYSSGVIVTGNLHANSGNNYVRSEATDGCIEIRRGAGEPFIDFKVNDVDFDARMKMNSNQNNEFEFSTGIIVPDNKKLNCGSSLDLEIFHENTNNNSVIHNKTGDLFIENDSGSTTEHIYIRPKAGENSLTLVPNGSVELHYDGNYRLTTQNAGVDMRRDEEVFINLARTDNAGGVDGAFVSSIIGLGKDDANNFTQYSKVITQVVDASNGTEDGRLIFQTMRDGSLVTAATVERGFFQRNTAPGFAGEAFQWVNTNPNMHNGSIKWTSGHFVNSTGIFTCPVAGKYLCMATVQSHRTNDLTGASDQYYNVLFQKNNINYFGETVGTQHANGASSTGISANHFQLTQAVIIDAAANETIRAHSNHGYRYAAQNHLSIILIA